VLILVRLMLGSVLLLVLGRISSADFSASRVREGFASRVRENFASRVRENLVACLRIANCSLESLKINLSKKFFCSCIEINISIG
jgi:hypothetical protein